MEVIPTSLLIEKHQMQATLYELSTIVFGSEGLAKLSTGDDKDEFDSLRVHHEVSRASKLLIEIAVILRNLIDNSFWPKDILHKIRIESRNELSVGIICEANKAEKPLSFRQACNKIIHAESISFGMKEIPSKMRCLDGKVELHGKRNETTWIASIEVADFIRMAVRQL